MLINVRLCISGIMTLEQSSHKKYCFAYMCCRVWFSCTHSGYSKYDWAKCANAANTANRIWGMINRTCSCKSRLLVGTLYKSVVHLHLDYGAQTWKHHLGNDMGFLEKILHRATHMIEENKNFLFCHMTRN